MASRSGSGSRRQRSRDPRDEYPSLPPLPRGVRIPSAQAPNPNVLEPSPGPRAVLSHAWSTSSRRAERAERIRHLDQQASSLDEWRRFVERYPPHSSSTDRDRSRVTRSSDTRPVNLDELDRSLDQANSHLRALLDLTHHSGLGAASSSPPMSRPRDLSPPGARPLELMDDNRRSKRRKLDAERSIPNYKIFRYGQFGQVEPGQLRMEMVSCDGGMYSNEPSFAAENILRDDQAVYCTKSNRCNIVLRHQGGTSFTLQELVIKGPTSMNYSHPVREGMVFMSMREDEQLDRTAHYLIQYAPRLRESSSQANGDDSTHADQRQERTTRSVRYNEDGTSSIHLRRTTVYRDEESDYRIAQMPHEFTSNIPNIGVTTECSDEEHDDDVGSHRFARRPPNRIGALPFEAPDSDEDTDEPVIRDFDFDEFLSSDPNIIFPGLNDHMAETREPATRETGNRESNGRRPASRGPVSREPTTRDPDRGMGVDSEPSAPGGELLVPHARFLIENKKSTCTIRFDPPVSGRFILLKMWNSHHDPNSNIDIQSVIARGFAGPRYFPSVELR